MKKKPRNVRSILKIRLKPEIVAGWFEHSNPQEHLDKLFMFLSERKDVICPPDVIERFRQKSVQAYKPDSAFEVSLMLRRNDAHGIQRRLYQSNWWKGQIVTKTFITKPRF
jgi:hypothetical protein